MGTEERRTGTWDRVEIKGSLRAGPFRGRMSAVFTIKLCPPHPLPSQTGETNKQKNTFKPISPLLPGLILLPRCAGRPLAGSRSPNVQPAAARPLPPQPRAGSPDRGTVAAAARSAGDGPSQSRPRCPCQTRDPSGRQTDLGLRAAPYRCGGRGAEGLRCPGSPSSSEPLPAPPSSWASRCRPCSAKGARGGISRRGRGHPGLPSSRGRCPALACRLAFGADRPWRSSGDPGSCGDRWSRDPELAAHPPRWGLRD